MRPTVGRWVYLAAGIGLLAGASRWSAPINAMRVDQKLVAASIEQDADPNHALALLMAVGRAPLVDYLWLRATKLKEEGRFFDALQLSEWICKLQPRFPSVWAFHAWNMAYNISVTLNSPEERWRWVKNGISLLRDRGIPANPHNTQLYRELAWIYFHKVADYLDDKHWYYKNEFALSMEDILGPGGEYDWKALAAAPHDWDALARDGDVVRLLDEMRSMRFDLSKPGVLLGLIEQREKARAATQPAEPPAFWSVMDDAAFKPAIRKVEDYWRSKRLREEMKIEPQRVVELREIFGPLDFRLAESHALYWANLGVAQGRDRAVGLDTEKLNTDRIELYCLQNMYRRGKLILSPEARKGVPPLMMPDTRFVPVLFKMFQDVSQNYKQTESDETAVVSENFESAFKNFIRDAIVRLYESGETADAQYYFNWTQEHFPHPDFANGIEIFVDLSIRSELKSMTTDQSKGHVAGFIRRALLLFAYGRDREAWAYFRLARRVYDAYEEMVRDAIKLPTFDRIVEDLITAAQAEMPPEMHQRLVSRLNLAKGAASRPAGPAQ